MVNSEKQELLSEAYVYCEKLYSGMGNLVNNIHERNLNDLESYTNNILTGFNWIVEVAVNVCNIEGINSNLGNIEDKTKMYIEAYNNLDLLLVSDIIEYELMPQVELFYNLFADTISSYNN